MKQIPRPNNVKEFNKLIKSVVKSTIKNCSKPLEEDLCQTVHAYFFTESGQKVLDRAETLSFLKTQIHYRTLDAHKEIHKALKDAIIASEYMDADSKYEYYDLVPDQSTSTEEMYLKKKKMLDLSDLFIREVQNLPKVSQSDFICYNWEGLSQICEMLSIDRVILAKNVLSSLNPRQIIKAFDHYDYHVDRAQEVLYPEVSEPIDLVKAEESYRRNAIRDLKGGGGVIRKICAKY